MKLLFLPLLLLLGFGSEPKVYPLRLRILSIQESTNRKFGYHNGHGRGNLREEDGMVHGIDFEFEDCSHGFKASVGPLAYEARLKKEFRLIVAGKEVGSDKIDECEFKYTPQKFMYTMHDGQIGTAPAKVIPLKTVPE